MRYRGGKQFVPNRNPQRNFKILCRNFMNGHCKRKNDCPYYHGVVEVAATELRTHGGGITSITEIFDDEPGLKFFTAGGDCSIKKWHVQGSNRLHVKLDGQMDHQNIICIGIAEGGQTFAIDLMGNFITVDTDVVSPVSVSFSNQILIIGYKNGSIKFFQFQGSQFVLIKKIDTAKSLTSLHYINNFLAVGGEGVFDVYDMDRNFEVIVSKNLQDAIEEIGEIDQKFLLTTSSGNLVSLDTRDGSEICANSFIPTHQNSMTTFIAFADSQHQKIYIVADKKGNLRLYRNEDFAPEFEWRVCEEPITALVKFSNKPFIAATSASGGIYLYRLLFSC